MSTLNSILIVGPTGSVGIAACRALISHKSDFHRIGAYNNLGSSSTPEKSALLADYKAGGMDIVDGDYNDPSAFQGQDNFKVVLESRELIKFSTAYTQVLTALFSHWGTTPSNYNLISSTLPSKAAYGTSIPPNSAQT